MAGTITRTSMSTQQRLCCTSGSTKSAAIKLSRQLADNGIFPYHIFTPRYEPRDIIIKFSHIDKKNELLNHEKLLEILVDCNCSLHTPTRSDVVDRSERSIFLWNLNPVFFFFVTREDGYEVDETLEQVMNETIEDIKSSVTQREMEITDHHFIQHNSNDVPRTLKLTFASIAQAKKFCEEDTNTSRGRFPAKFKKFDQHVPIKQCKICRMTDHRAGDTKCDKTPRCPRCLDPSHTQPLDNNMCIPKCWTHGRGHSSGSDRCPINRDLKRKLRRELDSKRREEIQLRDTPEEHQGFHRELIQLKETIKSSATSYAGVIKGAQPSAPNFRIPKITVDPNLCVMQYVCASLNDAYEPGVFQQYLDDFADLNKMPRAKYPPPCKNLLSTLVRNTPLGPGASVPPSSPASVGSPTRSPARVLGPALTEARAQPRPPHSSNQSSPNRAPPQPHHNLSLPPPSRDPRQTKRNPKPSPVLTPVASPTASTSSSIMEQDQKQASAIQNITKSVKERINRIELSPEASLAASPKRPPKHSPAVTRNKTTSTVPRSPISKSHSADVSLNRTLHEDPYAVWTLLEEQYSGKPSAVHPSQVERASRDERHQIECQVETSRTPLILAVCKSKSGPHGPLPVKQQDLLATLKLRKSISARNLARLIHDNRILYKSEPYLPFELIHEFAVNNAPVEHLKFELKSYPWVTTQKPITFRY